MARLDELLAAVYREPLSDAHRLVYADMLLEKGDLLGEFIQLQIARAGGRKRTQSRERLLLAVEGKRWWPGHPVWFTQQSIAWESTERGFPHLFNCGWPVNEPHLSEQLRQFGDLAGAPGWSTVRDVNLCSASPSTLPPFAAAMSEAVLMRSPFRSLRRLRSVPSTALAGIAGADLPVEFLEVNWVEGTGQLPAATGLPSLRHLVIHMRTGEGLGFAMGNVSPSGLLRRLDTLELVLSNVQGDVSALPSAIAAFATLPDSFRLIVHQSGLRTDFSGARAKPDLRLVLNSTVVAGTVEALGAIPKTALSSLHVDFATREEGGYFIEQDTPRMKLLVEKALKKWGKAGTVGWKLQKKK